MAASSNVFTSQERIESLKAGALSGAIAAGVGLGFSLLHRVLRDPWQGAGDVGAAQPHTIVAAHLGVAIVSGALFGVTYRYVVRQDDNPQLGAGAVGAFGLVRGLAQLEAGLGQQGSWTLALMLAESVGLFAIAQIALQLALRQRWIQPFGAVPPD